jgi:hypothetical protein
MTENFHDDPKITASGGIATGFRAYAEIGPPVRWETTPIFPLSGFGAALILALPLKPGQFRQAEFSEGS